MRESEIGKAKALSADFVEIKTAVCVVENSTARNITSSGLKWCLIPPFGYAESRAQHLLTRQPLHWFIDIAP